MYLVDTNIIIWVIRGARDYVQWFEQLKSTASLYTSVITVAEVYKNVFPEEITNTELTFDAIIPLDVTAGIARAAGFYWQQYSKQFRKIHILDCIIAATAQTHDLTLLTLNTRHFPMSDIKLLDPRKKKSG